ncbi:MAG: type IV secretory system conjugative DNA transfer family protein [Acidimicrobiales bacterium]
MPRSREFAPAADAQSRSERNMAAKEFFASTPQLPLTAQHRAVLAASAGASHGAYLGHSDRGWCFAEPQQSVMVLGPPRSGKTTSLIIPNVLSSNGPVVSTSTKPDVLDATATARSELGCCLLFDPTGSVGRSRGLLPLRWSPLQSCATWTAALSKARSLVEVGSATGSQRSLRGDRSHWTERAEALLAPLLHAGAIGGADMRTVLTWVDRRQALPAQQILAGEPGRSTELARNLLDGIVATDERELSGIWSTASGSLSGFRSDPALEATANPDFDPARFVESADTIYISAPAHLQASVAPMVVGLIEDIRHASYALRAAETSPGRSDPPVLLALDELANIAPIPDLPAMISEGGGQGLVTLACLQDLSQARSRWPDHAGGFPSLFGTTVVLPGIGDVRTLDALSILAGEEEIPTRAVSSGRTATDHPFTDLVSGGRPQHGESVSTQWRRRLPVDVIARGSPNQALALDERNQAKWVRLAPSHASEPWQSLRGLHRGHEQTLDPRSTLHPDYRRGRER